MTAGISRIIYCVYNNKGKRLMKRNIAILGFAIMIITIIWSIPGCDTLVTETVETAGHPTAEFTVNVDSGCAPLTVSFSDASSGPHDVWLWQFGDDSTSVESDPVHTYTEAGVYTVRLEIKDTETDGSDIEIKRRFIIVGATVGDFGASDTVACPGTEITFTPTDFGGVSSWLWSFGKPGWTSTDSIPSWTYPDTGIYTVSLTLNTSSEGCGTKTIIDSNLIRIHECPKVQFVIQNTSGCLPLSVPFADSSTPATGEAITSRLWDFGDGQTSTEQNPTHIYDSSGTFTVKLTIGDTGGGVSVDSLANVITAYDTLIPNMLVLSDSTACYSSFQQFQVKFDMDIFTDIDSFLWNFGDGIIATDSAPVHAYVTPGIYDVQLNVWGQCINDSIIKPGLIILSDTLDSLLAGINIVPASGVVADTFTISATSPNVMTGWDWALGDGTTATDSGAVITHTYADSGWYQILLTIRNGCGSITILDSVRVDL